MKNYFCIIILICISSLYSQNEEILHPVVGGEIFYLNDDVDWIKGIKVIKASTDEDADQVISLFAEILKNKNQCLIGEMTLLDLLTSFMSDDKETKYILIYHHNNIPVIYKHPYLKNNKVWFDAEYSKDVGSNTVSLWAFYFPGSGDPRIRLDGEGFATEFGVYSFMLDRFKKGKKINKVCGDLTVTGYGEYFEEPFYIIKGSEVDEYIRNGLKTYTDEFHVELGTIIGLECELTADDVDSKDYSIKIIHPKIASGLKKGVTIETSNKTFLKGEPDYILWGFTEEYELLPGEWEIQIIEDNKKIYSKKFQIHISK